MMKARARHILYRMLGVPALCVAALAIAPVASAQLAVSSNDTKVVNVDGVNKIVENPAPDNVTIVDLGVSPPKVVGQVNAPGSVVGRVVKKLKRPQELRPLPKRLNSDGG